MQVDIQQIKDRVLQQSEAVHRLQAEIGKIFSVTRERIRQIETVAMHKLQEPTCARRLAGFLEHPQPIKMEPCERAST